MPRASEYLNSNMSEPIQSPGVYLLIPAYTQDAMTQKGDRMIRVRWENEEGQSVWDNLAIVEGAGFRWAQLWFALGGEDVEFPDVSALASACMVKLNNGNAIYAKVGMEPYKGTKQEYKGTKVPAIVQMLSPAEGKALVGTNDTTNDSVPF